MKDINFTKFENDLIIEINQKLTSGHGMLYMILLMHKNKTEGMADSCFPSYNTLSEEANLAKNTLSKYLKDLQNKGYLIVKSGKSHTKKNSNEPNKYYFPKSHRSITMYSKEEYNELFKETNCNYEENPFG